MKYMDIVRAQQPEHPDMLVHLGILQMSIGMNERARGVFEKALEIQPDLGKALCGKVFCYPIWAKRKRLWLW